MRKYLIIILMLIIVGGLAQTVLANENITILACDNTHILNGSLVCPDGDSGFDHTFGEYRSLMANVTYTISVVGGAWGTTEITTFGDPTDVTNTPLQGWLWSLVIRYGTVNGFDSVMMGNHSEAGASIFHPTNGPYFTKASAQSAAQSAAVDPNNGVDPVNVSSSTGDFWFYIYDPSNRDNEGSLEINVSVVPEPISTTLFVVGGLVLGGRSYLRRKRA